MTAEEIGGGGVFVAGDGDEFATEACGHVLDETGFPTTGRPFEHQRELAAVGVFTEFDLLAGGQVEGNVRSGTNRGFHGGDHVSAGSELSASSVGRP